MCAAGLDGLVRRIRGFPTLGRREEKNSVMEAGISGSVESHRRCVTGFNICAAIPAKLEFGLHWLFKCCSHCVELPRWHCKYGSCRTSRGCRRRTQLHKLVLKSASSTRALTHMHACHSTEAASSCTTNKKSMYPYLQPLFCSMHAKQGLGARNKAAVNQQNVQCWMRWTIGLVELSRSPPPAISDMPDASTRRDAEWR